MNMIEKVARALAMEHQKKEGFTGPNDGDWRNYRSDARKAIEAMREPTEEMWIGVDTYNLVDGWYKMIDAALEEY